MSLDKQFGARELTKYLRELGFTPAPQVGSSHSKWFPPVGTDTSLCRYPFIIVIQGRKPYCHGTCSSYIKQIAKFKLPE